MAEQNILSSGVDVLEQIVSDMREHNDNVDRLDNLNNLIKGLTKEIESAEREIKAETDQKVSAATQAICAGFDKSIAEDKAKIKQVQGERDKAKAAGVNERISNETEALRKENELLKGQIVGAFKQEKIPMFANSELFFALFAARGIVDYVIYLAIMLVLFLGVPMTFFLIPDCSALIFVIYYFVMIMIWTLIDQLVDAKLIIPNVTTIEGARRNKEIIAKNKKKIGNITKGIRSDKNEEMYDLGQYDYNINELHDHIRDIEDEKAKALEEFEKNTKPDIVAEIEGRSKDRIIKAQSEIAKNKEEITKLDELVKQQRIYISSNYEAYLGKEFMNLDKLQEMSGFMKSGIAETIGQAMAAYKDRH